MKRVDYEYSMSELSSLAETADIEIVNSFIQTLEKPDSATLIGSGKLNELIALIDENKVSTIIFNDNLSSSQAKNISKKTNCNIVDRTELILDIFAKHAQTYESKLQVELAQLEYSYSKLRNLWQHFSRIVGGVGVRGPGEKQLEIDRRSVRKKISDLKAKLEQIKLTTETKRKKRSDQFSVCLIGYTNAGKSTLFNTLTKENIFTADKLFATLDATNRSFSLNTRDKIVLTDTIGFIDNLPTSLIQSFYSTLYEVRESDLLIHVVDINSIKRELHISVVNQILKDIKADDKDIIIVFNKIDTFTTLQNKFQRKQISNTHKDCVFISGEKGENIDLLKDKIINHINKHKVVMKFFVPSNMEKVLSFLHKNSEIQSLDYSDTEQMYECKTIINKNLIKNIQMQLDKSSMFYSINPYDR
jgi:GTP-binding protein HflX